MPIPSPMRFAIPVLAAGGLMGCVVAPPAPLIALPGENKTYPQFQQDDAACRTAAQAPQPATEPPIASAAGQTQAAATPVAAPVAAPVDPGLGYIQCMASRGNAITPLPQAYATAYAGYGYDYPAYGGYYPWLYADLITFGYFGGPGWYGAYGRFPHWYGYGYGGRFGYGGGRFGYGDRRFGGFERGGFERGGFGGGPGGGFRGGFGRGRG